MRLTRNLLVVSPFGVGVDSIDVASCKQIDVLLTIAKGVVDLPVAEAAVAWMLALNHRFLQKNRFVRNGELDARSGLMGSELRGKTIGVVDLGGIGSQLVSLICGVGMKLPVAFNAFAPADVFDSLGGRQCSPGGLLATAEFVALYFPLTDKNEIKFALRN